MPTDTPEEEHELGNLARSEGKGTRMRNWIGSVWKPVVVITSVAVLLMTLIVYANIHDSADAEDAGAMVPIAALAIAIFAAGLPALIVSTVGATIWHVTRRKAGPGNRVPAVTWTVDAPAPHPEPIRRGNPVGVVVERGNHPPARPPRTDAQWLNEPGQRFSTPATISKAHSYVAGGVVSALVVFRTPAGDYVRWNGALPTYREGDTGALTATVTAHSLFNGVPQTEVEDSTASWVPGPITASEQPPQEQVSEPQQITGMQQGQGMTEPPQTPSTAPGAKTPEVETPLPFNPTPEQTAEIREGVLRNSKRQADVMRREGTLPPAPLAPVTPAPTRRSKTKVDLADPERLNIVLAELDRLPGLESVARQVRTMANRVLISQQRRERGLKTAEMGMHSVFVGPPGTGKTTVARIWGRALAALGLLPSGHVVETDRGGLVGTTVGATAPKTEEKIAAAKGGVLFVDEAYALAPEDAARDFGAEAVSTMIKRMEDDRSEFAVIAAGYEHEMDRFLDSNPGLASRFSQTITFPNFDADALLAILHSQAADADYVLTQDAEGVAHKALVRLAAAPPKGWANARSVRGILGAAEAAQSERLVAETDLTDDALRTLTESDVRSALDERHPQAL